MPIRKLNHATFSINMNSNNSDFPHSFIHKTVLLESFEKMVSAAAGSFVCISIRSAVFLLESRLHFQVYREGNGIVTE